MWVLEIRTQGLMLMERHFTHSALSSTLTDISVFAFLDAFD